MAKYRSIQTSFWSDTKIIDEFTPEDRYFYLYLLTNEKSNQLGCYELSIKKMCNDTGYSKEIIKNLIDRFQNVHKIIYYDFKTKEIFLKNWHKYNWLDSDKTRVCIEKEFALVKSSELIDLICPLYAPYIPLGSNKKKKKKKKNNKKNSIEEESATPVAPPPPLFNLSNVLEYGIEKNASEEYCKKFYNYYTETKKKKWSSAEEWQNKFDEWYAKDEEENKETKITKLGEGVFKI